MKNFLTPAVLYNFIISPILFSFIFTHGNTPKENIIKILFTIIYICGAVLIGYCREASFQKKYKKNRDFDYKIYFDILKDNNITQISKDCMQTFFNKSIITPNDLPLTYWENFNPDDTQSSIEPLLSHPEIITRAFRGNTSKDDKCFIQCLFIPIDKNNNTLLISRDPEFHSHEKEMIMKGEHPKISFISFSPIPDRYLEKFDCQKAYEREVRDNIKREDKDFNYIGTVLRSDIKQIKDKKGTIIKETKKYYLFFIYKVIYKKVSFMTDKETTDWDIINNLFQTKPIVQVKYPWYKKVFLGKKKISYFQKDHDHIIQAIPLTQIPKDFDPQNISNPEKPSAELLSVEWLSINHLTS